MNNTTNTLYEKIPLAKLRQLEHKREMQREKDINDYKKFYQDHLSHLDKNNREATLKEFSAIKKIRDSKFSSDKSKLEFKINWLLKEYLKEPFRKVYDEDVELYREEKTYNSDKPLAKFVAIVCDNWQHSHRVNTEKEQKQENLLNYAERCLRNYGLSPYISNRNENKKKYNLSIITKDLSEKNRILLSKKELDEHFLDKYSQKRPIIIEGTEIQYPNIYQVTITSTLLQDDEIEFFALKNDFEWNDNYKDKGTIIEYCKNETDDILNNQKYSVKAFYTEVEQLLKPYSEAHKVYCKALSKLESGIYERNILDDLRLSLESFCKEKFRNNERLENQFPIIGKYLKDNGFTKHLRNLLRQLFSFYTEYQNAYVKHNDKVNKNEVEIIFDLTSTFMKFLVSV